jgi:hypothetical protein
VTHVAVGSADVRLEHFEKEGAKWASSDEVGLDYCVRRAQKVGVNTCSSMSCLLSEESNLKFDPTCDARGMDARILN